MSSTNGNQANEQSQDTLILCKHLPPNDSGGVFRPLSWAKYAFKNHVPVRFISQKPVNFSNPSQSGVHLAKQWPKSIKINYTEKNALDPAYRLIPRVDGSFKDAMDVVSTGLKIYKKTKPKSIVVTGPSFDYFIAGHYLSKIYNVPLILDYRDEWTLNPFKFVEATPDNEKWERKVLSNASEIIYTTESMAKKNYEYFQPKGNVHVVNNGWDPSDHTNVIDEIKPNTKQIELLFTGVLAEHTPPFPFLIDLDSVVEKYNVDVRVTFIGRITEEIRRDLEDLKLKFNIDIIAPIPRDQCFIKMQKADALLLFAPLKMERYIPGKLFDYAASKTHIIAHGVKGEIQTALNKGKLGTFINENDVEHLYKTLLSLKENNKTEPLAEWLNSKSREVLAKEFFDIVKNAS